MASPKMASSSAIIPFSLVFFLHLQPIQPTSSNSLAIRSHSSRLNTDNFDSRPAVSRNALSQLVQLHSGRSLPRVWRRRVLVVV
ncbi:hypothetical protein L218DRAFT_697949 [Marasmius fiardii PR-910]|nr:hypothetical protein L218DRAFT_697949 [Marasmius fiardii PR-910]